MDAFVKILGVCAGLSLLCACDVIKTYETAESFGTVRVEVGNGDVTVRPSPDDKIYVTATLAFGEEEPAYTVEPSASGSELVVTGKCAANDTTCLTDVEVLLPVDRKILAYTDQGSIDVEGIRGGGELRAITGDVVIDQLGGELALSTTAGKIFGSALIAEVVDATTESGPIELTFKSPPSDLSTVTGNGDITLYLPTTVEYLVDALTGRGDLKIDVAQATSSLYQVFARADIGDIMIYNACEGSAC
ncbi:MAG: DUF4097 family beta strand repeat protein [Myxococcales bacterium]|nr:DUF4097 family beta strand repeat protein [Myxococcales bacterium]